MHSMRSALHDVPVDGGRVGRLHAIPAEPAAADVAAQGCANERQSGEDSQGAFDELSDGLQQACCRRATS